MSSTLIAHCGGTYRTREELATIPTPAGTDTWRPVPHHELVSSLIDELYSREIEVTREQYATDGRDGARLFGTLDLRIPDFETPGLTPSLGLRGANDRSMAIQIIAAAHVFVCDNMAFSGSDGAVVLRKKHTRGLSLVRELPFAVESYLVKAESYLKDVDRMRDFVLSDDRAKGLIYDAFTGHRAALPLRLLLSVHELYFDDELQRAKFEDRSLWSLDNAFTEAVKRLPPVPQQRYGIEIGRFFARVLHAGSRRPVVALPAVPEEPAEPVDIMRPLPGHRVAEALLPWMS